MQRKFGVVNEAPNGKAMETVATIRNKIHSCDDKKLSQETKFYLKCVISD